MTEYLMSGLHLIAFLKGSYGLLRWSWVKDYQAHRTLSLLGMQASAEWISATCCKYAVKSDIWKNFAQQND